MSQRNPMNDRYQTDKHQGTTRKSAASAKPKAKAAATVTTGSPKKAYKERKAEQKAARKEEADRQREIDKKYSKPDTPRFKKLRKMWWGCIIGGVILTAISFIFRDQMPQPLSIGILIGAYALIILAFYIDFSKIRKERKNYQTTMMAKEIEDNKKARQAASAEKRKNASGKGSKKKK